MKLGLLCVAILGCGDSVHFAGDAHTESNQDSFDGPTDAQLDAPPDAGPMACTQAHQACAGPWCRVAPLPTEGTFTSVYAPTNAGDAWAYDATYPSLYHMDSCSWSRLEIPSSGWNTTLAPLGLYWTGSRITSRELGIPALRFSATDNWTACSHSDGTTSIDYGCSPTTIGGAATNDVWFGGANGMLWHWDGVALTGHDSPVAATFTRIVAFSATNVWMATAQDSYVWDGASFTHVGNPGLPTAPSAVTDFWFENSHWDGSTWTTMSTCPDARANEAAFNTTTAGWCVGKDGLVRRFVGTSWTDYLGADPASQPDGSVFYALNATTQLSSGIRYSDGATLTDSSSQLLVGDGNIDGRWTSAGAIPYALKHALPYVPITTNVFTAGGDEVWAMGLEDNPEFPPVWTLMHEKGGTWTQVQQVDGTADRRPILQDIKGSGPNDVWIAIGAQLLHWDGTAVTTAQAGTFRALWSPGANQIWALSTNLYMYDGTTWTTIAAPMGNGGVNSLWGTSATNIWAVDNTTFAHWTGTMWLYATHSSYPSAVAVWGTAANDVFFIDHTSIGHFDGAAFTKLVDVPSVLPTPSGVSAQAIFNSGDAVTRQLWLTRTAGAKGVIRFAAP